MNIMQPVNHNLIGRGEDDELISDFEDVLLLLC